MTEECCAKKHEAIAELALKREQRRGLFVVMLIKFAMFAAELAGGLIARSTALMADSVDMFGDGSVYALSIYALHRGPKWEAGAAIAKGPSSCCLARP